MTATAEASDKNFRVSRTAEEVRTPRQSRILHWWRISTLSMLASIAVLAPLASRDSIMTLPGRTAPSPSQSMMSEEL